MRSPDLKLWNLPRVFIEGRDTKNKIISAFELGNKMGSAI